MREFNFRVWDKTLKQFYNFEILGSNDDVQDHIDGWVVIQQYTGLQDKNGKGIFEGDIVKIGVEGQISVVEFELGAFVVKDSIAELERLDLFCNGKIGLGCLNEDYVKVIGNIYENPDLLEGKEE